MAGLFDVHELVDLAGVLAKAPAQARIGVSNAIVSTALDIRDTGKEIAPKASGKLADSIEATGPNSGPLRAGQSMVAEIGPTMFYGHMVENGTSQRGPRPYMAPACDRHEPTLLSEIAFAGWAAI